MQFIYNEKIIGKPLQNFYKKGIFELPKRLSKINYAAPFNVLKKWDLEETFAFNSYKLTFDYIHPLEQEQFDEK